MRWRPPTGCGGWALQTLEAGFYSDQGQGVDSLGHGEKSGLERQQKQKHDPKQNQRSTPTSRRVALLGPCSQLQIFIFPYSPSYEKAMAPHSSTFAWKIPWMGEPSGLPSMGSHRVGHD